MTRNPDDYKTPGQFIDALLSERGWTKRTLSVVLDVDESKINRLTSDRQPVSGEIAVLLEEVFGVDARQFLTLQASFDLAKARITTQTDPKRVTRAQLHHDLPVAEMIKRGWIAARDVRDQAVEAELPRFFGANRMEDVEVLPHAAKKTRVSEPPTPAQLAWLYRVRRIASELVVAKYTPQSVAAVIPKLKHLLLAAEEARKVPRLLAEAGVRFLVVETLPSAKIDGVCFWLNDNAPVVALTMRFDRIDNFWFVLRHELEHVLREHGKTQMMLDTDVDGEGAGGDDVPDDEKVANAAASEFCVPKKMMDAFIARKAPFFHDRDILAFAKMISVHPGLIAGQIRRRTNRYDRFGNYLVKVRSAVLPSAVVDGWGSVYPIE